MQLGLQFAVRWKSTLTVRSHELLPENVGNWSSSPQDESELSSRSIQSCFPLILGAQLQDITVSTFSI